MANRGRKSHSLPAAKIPAALKDIVDLNLLPGESPRLYEALLRDLVLALKPRDEIEHATVVDLTLSTLHAHRLRRIGTALLRAPIPIEAQEMNEEKHEKHMLRVSARNYVHREYRLLSAEEKRKKEEERYQARWREACLRREKERRAMELSTSPDIRALLHRKNVSAMMQAFKHHASDYERVMRILISSERRADRARLAISSHRSNLAFVRDQGRQIDEDFIREIDARKSRPDQIKKIWDARRNATTKAAQGTISKKLIKIDRSSGNNLPVPSEIVELFGSSDLMPGEDRKLYEGIFWSVAKQVRPRDIVEWLLIWRAVEYTLDGHRYHKILTQMLGIEIPVGVPDVRDRLREAAEQYYGKFSKEEKQQHAEDDERRRQELQREYESKRTPAAVATAMTQAFTTDAANFERLDRLVELAQQGRTSALEQIARHRASLSYASELSKVLDEIIDVEFQVMPNEPSPGKS
jgi:hypothetical protein